MVESGQAANDDGAQRRGYSFFQGTRLPLQFFAVAAATAPTTIEFMHRK
jgi:hypothetical protein